MQKSIDCDMLSIISSVLFVCVTGVSVVGANADDNTWSLQKASTMHSISNCNATFQIQTDFNPKDKDNPITFTFLKSTGKSVFSFNGHRSTEYMVYSNTCYYTKYVPMMPDCTIIAVDLMSAHQTWCRVVGLNKTMGFSLYSNSVKLQIERNRLVVSGHESAGDYVAELDLMSGKILEQRTTLAEAQVSREASRGQPEPTSGSNSPGVVIRPEGSLIKE